MGRFYAVTFTGATIAAASGDYDLFYIAPADDKPVRLWELYLTATSELGDAAEEILRVDVVRGHTVASSGGPGAVTPAPMMPSDAAAGCTARVADTTTANTGTTATLYSGGFNVRSGMERIWLPETTPWVTQGQSSIVVRLMAAVADDVTMSGTLIIEEIG